MEDPPLPAPQGHTTAVPAPSDPVRQSRPDLVSAVGPLVLWAAAACFLTFFNRFAAYFVPLPAQGSLPGNLLAIPYLLLLLLTLLHVGRSASRLPVSAAFEMITGGILALPALASLLIYGLVAVLPRFTPLANEFGAISGSLPIPVQTLINNFLAPIGLSLLGSGIGRIIKHPNTLLAGAGFAIFFDIIVVTMGTVAQILRSDASLIAAVSVGAGAAASPGSPPGGHGPSAGHAVEAISWVTIGPADVLFMAVFLAAVQRLNLSRRATFAWMFALLGTALVIVQTTALPIPALAPMGIAVLIANARHAAFTLQERRDLKIGAAFAVFCAALMVIGARRFAPPPPPLPLGFAFRPDPREQALVIYRVAPGSRAGKGSIRPGDAITGINGIALAKMTPEQIGEALIHARSAGGAFTVRRSGLDKPLTITLPAATASGR